MSNFYTGSHNPNYWNFMMNYLGPGGGIGIGSWERARKGNYNPNQIKTAIQQLHRSRGIGVGEGVRKYRMQGVQGIAHGLNRFQGGGGNLGLQHYLRARDSGEFNLADIPTLAARGGMFLPHRAQKQWEMDMAALNPPEPEPMPEEELFDVDPTNYTAAGSDVGSGAAGVLTKRDKYAGKSGSTSDLKRKNLLINKQVNLK